MPTNGSVMAVTAIVAAPTIESGVPRPLCSAREALVGTVTIAPRTSRKPAMDSLGTNLPILGNSLDKRMTAMRLIMSTAASTGCGAAPVAEIMDCTGPPPNKEEAISARLLTMVS